MNLEAIKIALEKRDHTMYFAGGTLCVDFDDGFVGLNLDGKGFIAYLGKPIDEKIDLTPEITEKVRAIYLETKGETSFYREMVKDNEKQIQS